MRYVLSLVSLVLLAGAGVSQGVVINEFHSGSPDYIEVCNLGSAPAAIGGWHILYFEDSQTPGGVAFTFPGGVVLAPDECAVVTEDATLASPVVPAGTQIFDFGANISANTGEPTSCLLADGAGNGVDYLAFGNPNGLLCPLEAATYLGLPGAPATTTAYSVPVPEGGGTNTLDVHQRHGRGDTDAGADWSMRDLGTETPGRLNAFQVPAAHATGAVPLAAGVRADVNAGYAPLTVHFTNDSDGEAELSSVRWDFDLANPGGATSSRHNASFTYTEPGTYFAGVTLVDPFGVSVSAPMAITVHPSTTFSPVTSLPYAEDMESPTPPGASHALLGGRGWTVDLLDAGSRVRTVDPAGLYAAYPGPASPGAGPRAAVLDSTSGQLATNEISLHVDMTATGDFRLQYSLLEAFDEADPADGVFLGDGFNEVKINDWHQTLAFPSVWARFEHVIDAAFMAANGLVVNSSTRITFRQRDNGMIGVDGLIIDDVELLPPLPAIPGQPCDPGAACMDLNDAVNAELQPVGSGAAGPFFARVIPGHALTFTFEGEPNQPIVLLSGPLNPGLFLFPGVGQIDIGTGVGPNAVILGVEAVASGMRAGLINSFFNTGPSGLAVMSFPAPPLPPGVLTSFQVIIGSSSTLVRIGNAVQLTVL